MHHIMLYPEILGETMIIPITVKKRPGTTAREREAGILEMPQEAGRAFVESLRGLPVTRHGIKFHVLQSILRP